jgi:exonuclease-1
LKLDIEIPDGYIEEFHRAENTFLYQLVFDPITRTLVPLTPYLPNVDPAELPYCGKYESKSVSF